jgi:DNA-directed RNA polymerase specialized sigma24 family protein
MRASVLRKFRMDWCRRLRVVKERPCCRAFQKGLSAEHREVIDLVYYHKRSIGEVGKIFGLSEGLVKSRMLDARRQWRGLLTI